MGRDIGAMTDQRGRGGGGGGQKEKDIQNVTEVFQYLLALVFFASH